MPAVDRAYLCAAYKRYESLLIAYDEVPFKADNFQNWLLKRGIHNLNPRTNG